MSAIRTYKILGLTDHRNHNDVESTYSLFRAMGAHPACAKIDVATRFNPANAAFFSGDSLTANHILPVNDNFTVENRNAFFETGEGFAAACTDYDFVMLRLPRPTSDAFLQRLEKEMGGHRIINTPSGIRKCGSKAYLVQFPEICPPIALVHTMDEARNFASQYPTVLKPLESSGGRGLLRWEQGQYWDGKSEVGEAEFFQILEENIGDGYLAMQFLKNVDQGDKRILVFNGEIIGAALRIAPKGSWLSNASLGASAAGAIADAEEQKMAQIIAKNLRNHGVIAFGFDTLVDDSGKRILSEINASCVNGLTSAEEFSGKPVFEMAANAIFHHIQSI